MDTAGVAAALNGIFGTIHALSLGGIGCQHEPDQALDEQATGGSSSGGPVIASRCLRCRLRVDMAKKPGEPSHDAHTAQLTPKGATLPRSIIAATQQLPCCSRGCVVNEV